MAGTSSVGPMDIFNPGNEIILLIWNEWNYFL